MTDIDWFFVVFTTFAIIGGCALVLIRWALPELPEKPTRIERIRHSVWGVL